MENVVCKVGVVVSKRSADVVAAVAAFFNELLKFRDDNVIAALAVDCLAEIVVNFLSSVKAEYNVVALFICKLNNVVVNEHTVCREGETEIFVMLFFNASCVGDNSLYNVKVHQRFSAEEIDLEVNSAA